MLEQIVCQDCGVGRFTDAAASASCRACAVGQYQDETGNCVAIFGQGRCGINCGNICYVGSFRCKDCQGGSYTSFPAQSECIKCGLGRWMPAGTVAANSSSQCLPCAEGSFGSSLGLVGECSLCPSGRYQPSQGKQVMLCVSTRLM